MAKEIDDLFIGPHDDLGIDSDSPTDQLDEGLQTEYQRFDNRFAPVQQAVLNLESTIGPDKQYERYKNLIPIMLRYHQARRLNRFLENKIHELVTNSEVNDTKDTVPTTLTCLLMGAGSQVVLQMYLDECEQLARNQPYSQPVHDFTRYASFRHCRAVTFPIGSLCVRDFLKISTKQISVAECVRFFAAASGIGHLLSKTDDHPVFRHMTAGLDDLHREFPFMSQDALHIAYNMAVALLVTDKDDLTTILPDIKKKFDTMRRAATEKPWRVPDDRILDQTVQQANKFIEVRSALLKRAAKVLFEPGNPEFAELKEVTQVYLNAHPALELFTFFALGFGGRSSLVDAYRRARKFIMDKSHGDFYALIAQKIANILEPYISEGSLFTHDDQDLFLDETKPQPADYVNWQELKKEISGIFQLSRNRDYPLEIEQINFGNLVIPSSVRIAFDKDNPNVFAILFVYQRSTDDSTELLLGFDVPKETLKWPILEEPSELHNLRATFMTVAQSILQEVKRHAQERKEKRSPDIASAQSIARREIHIIDPVRALRRQILGEIRDRARKEVWPLLTVAVPEKRTFGQKILAPSDDRLAGLSIQVRSSILEAIDLFNRGGGRLKTLKRPSADRPSHAWLRVGKWRILCTQSEDSVPGQQIFEIVHIGKRKDIYNEADLP